LGFLVTLIGFVPAGADEDLDQMIEQTRALRAKFLADRHRPLYHFVSPEGVCHPFDPNGSIFWKGQYHLMYIFQQGVDKEGEGLHHWGHAVSNDMLHWRILPPALMAGDGDEGIFSGNCFINKDGVPTIIYYGVGAGGCIAIAQDDDLIEWKKLESNPVVKQPKKKDPDYKKYRAGDPHGWLEGDSYYSIFGGNSRGMRATVFKGQELDEWEYVGYLLAHTVDGIALDEDTSCADMFKLDGKDVLVCISHRLGCRYYIGEWKDEQFYPESHAMMNWSGGRFFANDSFLDDRGRRILIAWVGEALLEEGKEKKGWAGVMSMPRVLSLAEDKTMRIKPIEEIEQLRINPRERKNISLTDGAELALDDIMGDCLEIDLEIDPGSASHVGLRVLRSPQGEEETIVAYEPASDELILDVTKSSLDKDVRYGTYRPHTAEGGEDIRVQRAPFKVTPGDTFRLRVFLDRSIIEVFADDRQCVTQRVYPSREDALGISLFCTGGSAKVLSLKVWDMAATNAW
jgi:sucrose-6-phosphate hydrolase SacC (GH32 family)